MLIKDAEKRIGILDIMKHDWVTSNGIKPIWKVMYPKLELSKGDTINVFTKVSVISMIKLKIRNKI